MAQVYVSIGSNQDRTRYIRASLDALVERFGLLQLSSVYESEAVGFDGDNFYNLVAGFSTDLPVGELSRLLKRIEDDNGRCRKGPKFSGRTLDIDILTYDELIGDHDGVQLPRDEILKNAFVLLPLAEVAPEVKHPEVGQSYQALWDGYEGGQKLWTVGFEWRGQTISSAH
ncbi:2-amino-4-hydroxy-6-hydroxymethyldihydropteridine diphosphokinase [Pontibacterium granulatum]|uniref:2-amino-4-hydroxy-6- hydroxymethyldihydropteridine diphosphokinase n=1 Tax=Pontibacterium granulatum TaxID=2036029 RepID=UPI00249A5224|nr:2-amino-4-hydroxy-6-hydroxymethyldihydropteridine diphosphokinase [Pontibacterium granulatum]MDI3322834.1 2-amino-4-hydroxy-6-hydroxymethyldihydropteridine diphosphokinase [Pontibacterium granulatum]